MSFVALVHIVFSFNIQAGGSAMLKDRLELLLDWRRCQEADLTVNASNSLCSLAKLKRISNIQHALRVLKELLATDEKLGKIESFA